MLTNLFRILPVPVTRTKFLVTGVWKLNDNRDFPDTNADGSIIHSQLPAN